MVRASCVKYQFRNKRSSHTRYIKTYTTNANDGISLAVQQNANKYHISFSFPTRRISHSCHKYISFIRDIYCHRHLTRGNTKKTNIYLPMTFGKLAIDPTMLLVKGEPKWLVRFSCRHKPTNAINVKELSIFLTHAFLQFQWNNSTLHLHQG